MLILSEKFTIYPFFRQFLFLFFDVAQSPARVRTTKTPSPLGERNQKRTDSTGHRKRELKDYKCYDW